MLKEKKSEKRGQCVLSSTMTAKPEVRKPLNIKCFVGERVYVESGCAMCSLILTFILILKQETFYDIHLFSCRLLQYLI